MKLSASYWKQPGGKTGFKAHMLNEGLDSRESKRRAKRAATKKIKSIKINKGFS